MNIILRFITPFVLGSVIAASIFGALIVLTPQVAGAQAIESETIFPVDTPTSGPSDIEVTKKILQTILGFLGILSLVILLLGGVKWMTAGGNDDATSDARKLFATGLIGFTLVASAWAIAMYVLRSLTESNL